jgi:ribosomal protein L7/L12
MALSNAEIIAAIKEKKLTEIVELVKMMETEFGVSAAPWPLPPPARPLAPPPLPPG